jgi:hypothetical protein
MSSYINNDETSTENCDIICDTNIDNNDNTTKNIEIASIPLLTKIDEIVIDSNKNQLVKSIQTALDEARLACAFALDIDKKTDDLLSKTKVIIPLGKQAQMNTKQNKTCINATLEALKSAQKMKNENLSSNSVNTATNIHLLSKNVLETANKSVEQITDVVTIAVETKKVSIDAGKAILSIKTAILNAQKIATRDMSLTQTIKDEIAVALEATKTALSHAIVADINISSIKSQTEITKISAVNALTYSKKTMNSAKANMAISKASLNSLNQITANIPGKPIKSIRDIKLKAQNTLVETNKVLENYDYIIRKVQIAKPKIEISVTSMQKMTESLEKLLSLLP